MVYTFDMNKEIVDKNSLLAARLNQLMEKTGVNKSGLARICGVTPQSAGKWFKTGSISKDSAIKIAEAFGVSLSWLLGDQSDTAELQLSDDFEPLVLNEQQRLLLSLFERLPDSEKTNHIAALQARIEDYDNLFNELLKTRGLKNLLKNK